ncbi:hypothetical protein NBRC111894_1481 [Sporolactobacillus inulinus]|uniref:Uncharacterized protein n=1 Tax=Sporolactobacillus inulinus TaxID=2078 RepID=A0A4Y1ZA54_9BACL|nr:hypothetical protein [Sporolactobacillus inulinus]GAY75927.1 hypothetical protein NBRC111894_1481 [Sporolactobacillus inulinus]
MLKQGKSMSSHSGVQDEVAARLAWTYPHAVAAASMAKQTVTEIKVQQDYFSSGNDDALLSGSERFQRLGTIGRNFATIRSVCNRTRNGASFIYAAS